MLKLELRNNALGGSVILFRSYFPHIGRSSRMGALAVNGPSGLVMADEPNPNGSPTPLPNQKRNRRGNYVLVGTLEETGLGRDTRTKDKDGMEG
eukprot:2332695-Pleurochrysis_carterae.AAC.1